ncbi:1-deoxy-D-xylulose-5-phosphate synthase [Striga asiatica]|uniref:1-deoxy-D-xylulose-5-phosphate synthase n=1 Tax=Striga asiatica TaxID=4170 RepID=A0A5A7QVR0_STRAF|nr:1-deoxy-D-xylulose-5-phosphate synthase [Striga asiatica]
MDMNRMFLSFPMGMTWRLAGSSESNPTKQPEGIGAAVMFGGTSERKTWPLTEKFESLRAKIEFVKPLGKTEEFEPFFMRLGAIFWWQRKKLERKGKKQMETSNY